MNKNKTKWTHTELQFKEADIVDTSEGTVYPPTIPPPFLLVSPWTHLHKVRVSHSLAVNVLHVYTSALGSCQTDASRWGEWRCRPPASAQRPPCLLRFTPFCGSAQTDKQKIGSPGPSQCRGMWTCGRPCQLAPRRPSSYDYTIYIVVWAPRQASLRCSRGKWWAQTSAEAEGQEATVNP